MRPRQTPRVISVAEAAFSPSSRSFRCTLGPNHPRPAVPRAQSASRRYLHCSTPLPSAYKHHAETSDPAPSPLSHSARELHSSARAVAQAQAQEQVLPEDDIWEPPIYDLLQAEHADAYGEYDLSPAVYDLDLDAAEDHSIVYEQDLPEAPVDAYDPTAPISSKKPHRRRKQVARDGPPLPPLPAGELPPDGSSRFDWRETSLSSRVLKPHGKTWFPELPQVWRKKAEKVQLSPGWPFHDEIHRYVEHFEPLLQAEHDEAERQFLQRLTDWPEDTLIKHGVMLKDLVANPFKPPKWTDKQIVTFSKDGQKSLSALGGSETKGSNGADQPHKFDIGSHVFLSRTDPTIDPALANGQVRDRTYTEGDAKDDPIDPSSWLKATVYSKGKNFVRVAIPVEIEGLFSGRWRLDLGMSDYSLQLQLAAIKALHNDPIQQDLEDTVQADTAPSFPASRSDKDDGEDSAIDAVMRELDRVKHKVPQTILNGTSVRDALLRAFQTDYLPPALSRHAHAVVAETTNMKPTDIDATPLPTPHAAAAPRGVLARDQLIESWTRRYRSADPISIEGDPSIPLNSSQLRAIAMMLSERVSLVQGPPGTGKTRVIVETIKLLKSHWKIPHPILVTAHTNVAVDNLLAGLRTHGLKAVRSGSLDKVPEQLQEYTLDSQAEKHPLFEVVDAAKKDLEDMQQQARNQAQEGYYNWPAHNLRVNALRSKVYGLERLIHREVLLSADVICTTCLSSASRKLDGIDFPIVFLDEASMATEPLSIVPLMKGSSHVAIIGDHKQLPPVIISPEAHAGGLATSLFERLIHEKHIPSIMLDTQYRMHPAISAFPNKAFYASALSDGTTLPDGSALPGFEPPSTVYLLPGKNVTFIDHDHPESPQMSSLANHGDANIVASIVADLLIRNPDLSGSQIGIIAPYTAQVRLISDHLLVTQDRQEAFLDILGPERFKQLAEIEVKTVDGFEGREKDVIICSMVRCNPAGYVGFLGDWRRLNVALTRARQALLIVGSSQTLGKAKVGKFASETLPQGGDRVLRDHVRHLKSEGLVMRAEYE